MRHRLGIVVLALLGSCGGGGGGGDDGGGSPGPGPVAPQDPAARLARGRAILERCALAHAPDVIEWITAYALLDPEAPPPAPLLTITRVDVVNLEIGWALDLEPDGTLDATGTLFFLDAAGQRTFPLSPLELLALLGGTIDLPALLATIPDGTHAVFTFAWLTALEADGTLDLLYVGGVPTTASGSLRVPHDDCAATYAFEDVDVADLRGPYPTLVLDVEVRSAEGDVLGTATLDGTSVARLDAQFDGESFTLFVDLATGAVVDG